MRKFHPIHLFLGLLVFLASRGNCAPADSARWMVEASPRAIKFGRDAGSWDFYAFSTLSVSAEKWSFDGVFNGVADHEQDPWDLSILTSGYDLGFDRYWALGPGRVGVRQEIQCDGFPTIEKHDVSVSLAGYTAAIGLVDLGRLSFGFCLGPQVSWSYYRSDEYGWHEKSQKLGIQLATELLGRIYF